MEETPALRSMRIQKQNEVDFLIEFGSERHMVTLNKPKDLPAFASDLKRALGIHAEKDIEVSYLNMATHKYIKMKDVNMLYPAYTGRMYIKVQLADDRDNADCSRM